MNDKKNIKEPTDITFCEIPSSKVINNRNLNCIKIKDKNNKKTLFLCFCRGFSVLITEFCVNSHERLIIIIFFRFFVSVFSKLRNMIVLYFGQNIRQLFGAFL